MEWSHARSDHSLIIEAGKGMIVNNECYVPVA